MKKEADPEILFVESAVVWFMEKGKQYHVPFLAALISGLLAHMFAFTNKLVNHDEAVSLFSKGMSLSSGRWGLDILSWIFPDYSMPWIYGIISIVFIAVAVCIIVNLFEIDRKLFQILLAGLVMSFPSLTGMMTYMFTASSYAAAFLLAVLAVWCVCADDWRLRGAGLLAMVLSLSIYQAYIALCSGLLVLVLIRQVLRGDEEGAIMRRGFCFVGFLAASLGVYYGLTQMLLCLCGVRFNSYAAGNIAFNLSAVWNGIMQAYSAIGESLLRNPYGIIPGEGSRFIHWVCIAAMMLLILRWIWENRVNWKRVLLLCGLLGLFPLAINCMFLFAAESAVHTLVLYSFVCVYLLMLIVLQEGYSEKVERFAMNLIMLGLCVIMVANTYVSNEVYLHLHLRYENAYSFYTTLYADIRMLPGYSSDSKLAIIGDYTERGFYDTHFSEELRITGAGGFVPTDYSWEYFMQYYTGIYIPLASDEEVAAVMESAEFQQMELSPYYGSVRMIDDIIVVKLS